MLKVATTGLFVAISIIFTFLSWQNIHQIRKEIVQMDMIRYLCITFHSKDLYGQFTIYPHTGIHNNCQTGWMRRKDGCCNLSWYYLGFLCPWCQYSQSIWSQLDPMFQFIPSIILLPGHFSSVEQVSTSSSTMSSTQTSERNSKSTMVAKKFWRHRATLSTAILVVKSP